MATENEGLEAEIGITLNKLTKQLSVAEARMVKTAKKFEKDFDKANRGVERGFLRMDAAAGRFQNNTGRLGGVIAGALSVREIQRYADAWTVAGNKIAAAAQVAGREARSLSEVNDIADKTRSGIEETADLYAKLLRSTKDVAESEKEVAKATELVNKAFKAGGAAASEQAAGILQLAQGLSSGVLQGDELRSIRENAPMVAQAIADEFGVTIGKLKELGAAGELTSDRVFRAILKSEAKIESAFGKTNSTIGESFTRLQNALTEYIGDADAASGATVKIATALNLLADNLDLVVAAGGILAGRFIGPVLLGMFARAVPILKNGATALLAVRSGAGAAAVGLASLRGALALLGGPFGVLIAGLTALPILFGDTGASAGDLADAARDGEDALQRYAAAAKAVADEQERMGGKISAATAKIRDQSRAALQDSLRGLQDDLDAVRDDLAGVGLLDRSEAKAVADRFRGILMQAARGVDYDFSTDVFQEIVDALDDVAARGGDLGKVSKMLERIAGAGQEVFDVIEDLDRARLDPESLSLPQAREALAKMAEQLGGFEEELSAIGNAKGPRELQEAFDTLRDKMAGVATAAAMMGDAAGVELREMVLAGAKAQEQVDRLEGSLSATGDELDEIAKQGNPFDEMTRGAREAADAVDNLNAKANAARGEYARSRIAGERLFRKDLDMTPYSQPKSRLDKTDMDASAIRSLALLEKAAGMTFKINSAHRDAAHNAKVGGAKSSQHILGRALDIDVSHMTREMRVELIKMAREVGFGGIGVYKNALHFDTGPTRAWGPDYSSGSIPGWAVDALGTSRGSGEGAHVDLLKSETDETSKLEKTKRDLIAAAREDIATREHEISLIGQSVEAQVRERTERELLNEAKRAGIDVDKTLTDSGKTYRQEIEEIAAATGKLAAQEQARLKVLEDTRKKQQEVGESAKFWNGIQSQLEDGIIDAIVDGRNLGEVFANLAKQIAKAALQAALFGKGPMAGGMGGGGLLGGLMGSLFGGFRAAGGPVSPSKGYIVGEEGPEFFKPNTAGTILPHSMMTAPKMAQYHNIASPQSNVNVTTAAPKVIVLDDKRKIFDAMLSDEGRVVFSILRQEAGA